MKNNIKALRSSAGITQENLAEITQVTRQTINAIEKNKYYPSLILALKIARVFKKKIEEIFVFEEEKAK